MFEIDAEYATVRLLRDIPDVDAGTIGTAVATNGVVTLVKFPGDDVREYRVLVDALEQL